MASGFVSSGVLLHGEKRPGLCSRSSGSHHVRPRRTGGRLLRMSSGQVRTRQHVNPLADYLQKPIVLAEEWPQNVFEDVNRPLHVDIGVAKGRFVLDMAEKDGDRNFLGLEIREPLIGQANSWRDQKGLRNLDYLFANANVSLDSILSRFPPGTIENISIQFPDPWFKKRHQKRRVVQPELVDIITKHLRPGGHFYIVSDVRDVAEEMFANAKESSLLQDTTPDSWLPENPFGTMTERERSCMLQERPIYAKLFARLNNAS